ncbi:MAG: recombinase family protein [Candidatus Vogelbacteria bacterium]|nr:recombinase family protein [Candidatus Vogelbacteria bacterium]
MTGKPVYFAYIRVSTPRQGEQGSSLAAQRRSIEYYAARHNIMISEWIEETVTAAKAGRPLFTQMLTRLRKGQATGVIIHKIDRGARNLKDWAALGELIDHGIEVRFVADSVDLSSRSGRLSADIQAVVAADYVRNLKEEARKGFYGRLNQGLYPLGAPLGYLNNGRGKVKTWCPETAPLVRRAFELYAAGEFTLRQLSAECFSRGLRNSTGHSVSNNALARILRNRFYCGQMVLGKSGEVFAGLHEPFIPDDLFRRVGAILNGRMRRKVKSPSLVYRKLLRCASCRNHLIGEIKKGHTYYRCHTKGCPVKCVRSEIIDRQVQEKIQRLQADSKVYVDRLS